MKTSTSELLETILSITARVEGFLYRCRNDRAYSMLHISEAVETLSGYSAIDFIDNNKRAYSAIIHPEDLSEVYEKVDEALISRAKWELDYRIVRSDGRALWVHEVGAGVFDQDNLLYLEGFVLDISRRKQVEVELLESKEALKRSEERYALAFEGAYDGLWDRDLRTGKAFFSPRCFEIVGYPKMEDSAGRTVDYDWWTARIHPEDSMSVLEAIDHALKSGKRSFSVEYRIRRANGTFCWVSDRGAISRDAVRAPYRVAGSFTDISARKLAVELQRTLESQLQQSQKTEALGTLAGGIAHDINNTLVPIIGTVDLLLADAPEDGDLREGLQDVMVAATKVQLMVRQILAFSRQEGVERFDIDMRSEITSTLRMLRSMVPTTIALHFNSHLANAVCHVNATQLYQLVMNLVGNAVGAIGSNKGAIRIVLDRIDIRESATITGQEVNAGPFCRMTIIDSGPGIPADVMPRLFDPFFTTKPVGEGTGLGLSVVYGIARDHHGFIQASNERGAGARFDVHFPLIEANLAVDAILKG